MKLASILLFVMLSGISLNASATNHIITFDQSLKYSPKTLNVNVGDTIIWKGPFEGHPLRETAVPSGATHIPDVDADTIFAYVVTMPGDYSYHCLFHGSIGMTGSFTAANAGVPVTNSSNTVSQNFPNPTAGHETMIHLMLKKPQSVKIEVFDAKGTLVATPLNGMQPEGMQMVSLDVLGLPSGNYSYVVTTDGEVTRKNMVVLK